MFLSPEAICLGDDVVFYSGTHPVTPTDRVLGKCCELNFFFAMSAGGLKKIVGEMKCTLVYRYLRMKRRAF